MKPPGKTTLSRMQLTAQQEAERIEISQDGRVREGMLKEPMREQVARRDDFAGIVRLIDIIMSDQVLLERVNARSSDRNKTGAVSKPDVDEADAGDDSESAPA